jgi:hypothetical protein
MAGRESHRYLEITCVENGWETVRFEIVVLTIVANRVRLDIIKVSQRQWSYFSLLLATLVSRDGQADAYQTYREIRAIYPHGQNTSFTTGGRTTVTAGAVTRSGSTLPAQEAEGEVGTEAATQRKMNPDQRVRLGQARQSQITSRRTKSALNAFAITFNGRITPTGN